MTQDSLVCGVVVTYNPDDDVLENLRVVVAECGHVIVVDNASPPDWQARLAAIPGVECCFLPENRGVAAALNIGAQRAVAAGCHWIVTFDQDSKPEDGMGAALLAARQRHSRAAVIGPRIVEKTLVSGGYRWLRRHPLCGCLFQRVECQGDDLPEVTMVITSGAMLDLATWKAVGGFDEDLFIDYVDIDYCLRVDRLGRAIAVARAATLQHRLGDRRLRYLLGKEFRPMYHSALRHYYIARNRMRVWRRHARAVPHWALFDLCFAVGNTIRVALFEPEKWRKVKAMVLGTWDGLMGRTGPCPDGRRKSV